jgi:pimeloyl-ACP methyl ester carboxylesterase
MPTVHRIVTPDGLQLAAEEWGTPDKPTLVLVHGYPDSREVWNKVAPQLANDFHVIAYDVRGAGESDAPKSVRGYRLRNLVADFTQVIDALAPGRAVHVAGHDWGSIQAWEIVSLLGPRIASFTSISGPCLDHIGHWMRERGGRRGRGSLKDMLRQNLRSWYIFLFHAPLIAPTAWKLGLADLWPRMLDKSEGVTDAPYDSKTLAKNGSLGVNLYRANIFPRLLRPNDRFVQAPVQVVIPLRDKFVDPTLFDDLDQWVPNLEKRTMAAGHWVPLSHPEEVAAHIGGFASRHCR